MSGADRLAATFLLVFAVVVYGTALLRHRATGRDKTLRMLATAALGLAVVGLFAVWG